ncbi:MAG: transposase [Candidatus Schekmanbacteria bacterium]|nr:transposase [Candidatus Schekmanbacteria bacterium]
MARKRTKGSGGHRCVRRLSVPLNRGKWDRIEAVARSYAREKDDHLLDLSSASVFAEVLSFETARDGLLDAGYTSLANLQGRQWKMAMKDAFETVEKQWASLAVDIRGLVAKQQAWTEAEKHYAYWILMNSHRIATLVAGQAPVPDHFAVSRSEKRRVRSYLRRVIRRQRGRAPRVSRARSFTLDANMYSVFEYAQRQYLSIMSLEPGARIAVPLIGRAAISGNIRIVLDRDRRRVEAHVIQEVVPVKPLEGKPAAVDAGVTEVLTDELGNRYGEGFGKVLGTFSDRVCDKGKKRSKLRSVAKKARDRGDGKKAHRIETRNLGTKKLSASRQRMRAEIERRIDEATNQVLAVRTPAVLVTERLDIRGKAKSRRLSRMVSRWARKYLKDRVEFTASARGARREQVNASYSSQTCPVPTCGYVHADNRQGDRFQCGHCGYTGEADTVAAINLLARFEDPEIRLLTPKDRVKSILQRRFNARLESREATVSGRTPDAEGRSVRAERSHVGETSVSCVPPRQSESETTGAIPSLDGREVIRGRAVPCPLAPRIGENAGAKRDHHV